jgi:serine/threonine protein kinase
MDTYEIFAMKEMGKKKVKKEGSEWLCLSEKTILSMTRSPFVLRLRYAFHDNDSLYLVFNMCAGGDLKYHLRLDGKICSFPNARARFHAAEVLLGLEHLHSMEIVYRDLKPNNILLTEEGIAMVEFALIFIYQFFIGHCVISDLGLATKLKKDKTLKHLAGTAVRVLAFSIDCFRLFRHGSSVIYSFYHCLFFCQNILYFFCEPTP